MPFYNYHKDKIVSDNTEIEVSKILSALGFKIHSFNNDNKYDILTSKNNVEYKVEVKEDFTCEKTGNVGLEFECRGKPSGISVSESYFYVYKIHSKSGIIYLAISSKILKLMIELKLYHRVVVGGDKGSNSKNYLFNLEQFVDMGIVIK